MAKGITNETRSVGLKKFKPSPEIRNGLCIGTLVDVNVGVAKIKNDSSMETFRNLEIPRLNFVFESRLDPEGVKTSTYIHSFLAIEHTPESIIDGKDGGLWRWNQLSQTIKHLLDVYRNNAPFTENELKMLSVDFEDEVDGVFKEQPASIVIAAYTKFFNNIVKLFKPGDKAIYKDANGKDIIVWMKLLLDIKGYFVNNGDFGFSSYPGEGLIEIYHQNIPPSLSINIAKGENIIPKASGAAPAKAVAVTPIMNNNPIQQANTPSFLRGGK